MLLLDIVSAPFISKYSLKDKGSILILMYRPKSIVAKSPESKWALEPIIYTSLPDFFKCDIKTL